VPHLPRLSGGLLFFQCNDPVDAIDIGDRHATQNSQRDVSVNRVSVKLDVEPLSQRGAARKPFLQAFRRRIDLLLHDPLGITRIPQG
jgi:hypothetical protein